MIKFIGRRSEDGRTFSANKILECVYNSNAQSGARYKVLFAEKHEFSIPGRPGKLIYIFQTAYIFTSKSQKVKKKNVTSLLRWDYHTSHDSGIHRERKSL